MKAVGVDLGGTKIEAIVMNNKGKIINTVRIPTQVKKGRTTIINNIVHAVKTVSKGHKIKGVGIAIPGFLKKGKLTSAHNMGTLMGCKLYDILKKKIRKPLYLENDANCFALAEQRFGAAKGADHCVGVIVGTGLGFGLILNGAIYHGTNGGAGELTHSFFPFEKKEFESFVAGPDLAKQFNKKTGKKATAKEIFASKESKAKAIVKEQHNYLAIIFSYIVDLLNPQKIVIGGGVSNSMNYSLLNKLVKKYSYPSLAADVKVVKHKISDAAGSLGAAALVFVHESSL